MGETTEPGGRKITLRIVDVDADHPVCAAITEVACRIADEHGVTLFASDEPLRPSTGGA